MHQRHALYARQASGCHRDSRNGTPVDEPGADLLLDFHDHIFRSVHDLTAAIDGRLATLVSSRGRESPCVSSNGPLPHGHTVARTGTSFTVKSCGSWAHSPTPSNQTAWCAATTGSHGRITAFP